MRILGLSASILAIVALNGCAQRPPTQSLAPPQPTPTCSSEVSCAQKWADAREAIQSVVGMRLRTTTDTYLETYVRNRMPFLVGKVEKVPLGGNKYEIRGRVECADRNPSLCGNLPYTGTNAFNAIVGTE
ncbi:Hypothetical protein BN117_2078 [Bordetella parapertussis Bpp5]|uniref:Lipoprotein n=1 Tax=Bordetella parapertussis (strain Bpp5) TaxID=1208660 RepID=K0M908_BORPB|nr:Hypothetical protein BN117_2078 [Bordetella parapertussis Bpp5]